MRRAVVVGAGITGLAAAHTLKISDPEIGLTVLESGPLEGGKLATGEVAGVPVDLGADSAVDRSGALAQWFREVGVQHVGTPRVFGASILLGERLVPLPRSTIMGIPLELKTPVRTGLLSPRAAARALFDRAVITPLSGPDVSVGTFMRRRFGKGVVDNMIDPVLAGTRAGRVDEISLAAALPEVDLVARSHRSLAKGLRRTGGAGATTASFIRPRGGMSELVENLVATIGAHNIHLETNVVSIDRTTRGYRALTGDGRIFSADVIIMTAPAYDAAGMLRGLDENLANKLAAIEFVSPWVATFAFRKAERLPAGRSGILVPSARRTGFDACTFYSTKWDLGPDAPVIVRVFGGRDSNGSAVPAEEGVTRLEAEVSRLLGCGKSIDHRVVQWRRGLPIYRVGHRELVEQIFERVRMYPGLELAGAAYNGSGIAACVEGARAAVQHATAGNPARPPTP